MSQAEKTLISIQNLLNQSGFSPQTAIHILLENFHKAY